MQIWKKIQKYNHALREEGISLSYVVSLEFSSSPKKAVKYAAFAIKTYQFKIAYGPFHVYSFLKKYQKYEKNKDSGEI